MPSIPTPPPETQPTVPTSIKVLVTAFGVGGRFDSKPELMTVAMGSQSHHIAALLPQTLPSDPAVEIIIYTPLKVSYSDVSTQLPRLLEKHQPDIVLHIGLAGGRKHYAIERSSLRGRYIYRDADGSGLTQEENDEIFPNDTPECIVTGYDYDKVFEAWWQGCKRDVKWRYSKRVMMWGSTFVDLAIIRRFRGIGGGMGMEGKSCSCMCLNVLKRRMWRLARRLP
jgi:hypothetical protein